MGRDSLETQPLAPSAEDNVDSELYSTLRTPVVSRKWIWITSIICFVQATVILGQWFHITSLSKDIASRPECLEPRMLYSPAYEAVEPEIKVFSVGHSWSGNTRWQGNSPEVDESWQELYNNTILRIPKQQAELLPNRTVPISGDPEGYYLAQIDVFHQLHCLNMIRMKLGGDYYKDFAYELDDDHISHCVDSVRQSLMCSFDTSVNVWQWNDKAKALVGHSSSAHQCRNYEKLRDWAVEHGAFGDHLPLSIKPPEDDLEWPHDIFSDGSISEEPGFPYDLHVHPL